jgi:hypothetical protein
VLLLAVVTVGILVAVSPPSTRAKLRLVAPIAFTLVVIAMPLIVWTASSGGDEKSLFVERAISLTGAPELIVSLGDDDLNRMETTRGRRVVRVQCVGRRGQTVVDATQRWPFIYEKGYEYPHIHQAASREQVQRADRCRVRGTRVRLEAGVEGALRR